MQAELATAELERQQLQKQLANADDEAQRKALQQQLELQSKQLPAAAATSDAGQARQGHCAPGDPLCSDLDQPTGSPSAVPNGLIPLDRH